jgi:hypothetical protein
MIGIMTRGGLGGNRSHKERPAAELRLELGLSGEAAEAWRKIETVLRGIAKEPGSDGDFLAEVEQAIARKHREVEAEIAEACAALRAAVTEEMREILTGSPILRNPTWL